MNPTIVLVFALFSTALCGCLNDWDTGHASSAYSTRLYSYSSSKAAAVKSSSELTFLTFNMYSGFTLSCGWGPSSQIAQITSSDYVGTQETVQGVDTRCNCNMPKLIADGAGMSTRFLMTIPWRTGQYGVAAGTSQTILETKYQLFNYGGVEQRGVIAVRTQPPGLNGRNLWFLNTHVEYYVWAARQSQTTQLINFAKALVAADPNCIIVVTGDFNGGPSDSMYSTMKGYFQNAWEVYNGSPNGGNTLPADWPGNRFDHVWYRVPSGVTARPTNVEVLNVLLSDHRPVRARIQFTVPGSSPSTPAPTPAPTRAPATPAPTPAPTKAPSTPAPTPAPTRAPVTSAPTPAPTSAPPKGATSAPTGSASGGSCSVSISGTASSPVIIKNIGSKPVKKLVLSFSPSLPSNNWNFVSEGSNRFTLPDWAYQSLAANGQTYSSSGFYATGTQPTVTVASITC